MTEYDASLKMLKELTDANGIPGNERQPRDVMRKYIEPFADKIETDNLGSLIAEKVGDAKGPKIMIAGHLDEIGFMVTQVDDLGFVKFQSVGGWWNQVLLAQRMTITTRSGEEIIGVIGSTPPHILSADAKGKPVEIKDMFLDIGATSKEEVRSWGIAPGDMITPYFEFHVMKNEKYLLAKAWDNRIGCAIVIDIMRELKDINHPNIIYGVGDVQEEVGLRGAKTATFKIRPDIGFAVDVGIAGDTPGISPRDSTSKMGNGPQIIIYDSSMVSHKGLREFVIDTAEENNIPFQYESIAAGGTDAGSIHITANGVPTLSIGIATRYIHSHAGILHRDDYENTVKLLVAVIRKLDRDTVNKIIFD